jgi:indole-3-glycerol phosphate synthase
MNSPTFLERIKESTCRRVAQRKELIPFKKLSSSEFSRSNPKPFSNCFCQDTPVSHYDENPSAGFHNKTNKTNLTNDRQPRIIAEVKYQSPSQGVINRELNPLDLAISYQEVGAAAISVLTEPEYFGGKIENLRLIREKLPQAVLLQKDFIIDEYQIYEALVCGADCILLIIALLGEKRTEEFLKMSQSLGLSALVEVHNETEMKIAIDLGATVIGVNNRDLKSLKVSLDVSRQLANAITQLPEQSIAISESGISTSAEITELSELGYKGFLIGTSLMKTSDPALALAKLIKGQSQRVYK